MIVLSSFTCNAIDTSTASMTCVLLLLSRDGQLARVRRDQAEGNENRQKVVQLELEPVDDDEAFERSEGKEEEGGVGGEAGESGRDLSILQSAAVLPKMPWTWPPIPPSE